MSPSKTTTGDRVPLCEHYDGDGRCTDPSKICLGRGLGDTCLDPRIHGPAPERRDDTLNDILVECCKLRGCFPLMHRTLHEFDWFVDAVIWGAGRLLEREIREAEEAGNDTLAQGLKARRDLENRLQARFKKKYYDCSSDGLELIRLAEAFQIYCKEQYGPIQVFSRDFGDAQKQARLFPREGEA